MNPKMQKLIQASVRGDQRAFGKIVDAYQGAVSAMAYSVCGDFSQSEDLAQETFVIAWQKLPHLRKRESLSAWLCGIARNLARDWLRKKAKAPSVSLESVAEPAHPEEDEPTRRERSETVWAALQAIPENYREPLVLFYRKDLSIRDIAEALELSEDCVKQRLSRGRKMLRAEVAKMVEDTLEDARPGKGFTAGVLATLPPLGAANMPTAAARKSPASRIVTAIAKKAALGAAMTAVLAALVFGGAWGLQKIAAKRFERTSARTPYSPVSYHASRAEPAAAIPASSAENQKVSPGAAASAESEETAALPQGTASVSGRVIFKHTGIPAEGMRVLFGTNEGGEKTLTDDEGRFSFQDIAPGDYVLLAFDDHYDDVPEDWLRSDHVPVSLSAGEKKSDMRLEVPSKGGQLKGRVYDKTTKEPLSGISISTFRVGSHSCQGKSDENGYYRIVGLPEGESLVRIERNNPVFCSSQTNTMHTITVDAENTTSLDLAIDRGIPLSGQVVDMDGKAVQEANIDAVLFVSDSRGRLDCYFKSDDEGKFTVWGASPGDRVALSARKRDGLASSLEVVDPVPEAAVENIVLTLRPTVRISGRFMNESGRPVKANFWRRPIHPEGVGQWRGQADEPSETFEITLAQGDYEVKGMPKGNDFGVEPAVQSLKVGQEPVSNVTVRVVTQSELIGELSLHGVVVDEEDKPLRNTRVYIDGASATNLRSFQSTHTDEEGRFSFEGLMDDRYRVHATPNPPFERFCGFDDLNPADTPEVVIVARLAATLRGRVLDAETNEPIGSFSADCGKRHMFGGESRWEQKNITSDAGLFVLPVRLDEDWYLRIAADGYAPVTQTGTALSSGETVDNLEFRLMSSRTIRGTVTNESGEPISRAFIYHNKDVFDASKRSRQYAATESGADGSFELRSLPGEAVTLYAFKEGYAIAHAAIMPEMRLVLPQGGIIEGQILIGGAPPQGKASITAFEPETHHNRWAKVDENGDYRITELMDAGYLLQINLRDETTNESIGSYMLTDSLDAANGMTITHDIRIPLGNAILEGVLTQDGLPVAGLPLKCFRAGYATHGSADEAGRYRFENIPAGLVEIKHLIPDEAAPGGYGHRTLLSLEIQEGATIQQDCELGESGSDVP
jgi:RNA polymerase sigma factor (sigma-70 family)